MITDDEIIQLSDDPELTFVGFEKIVRARYYEAEAERLEIQYGNADSHRLEYLNKVLAAARVYEISALAQWQVPNVDGRIQSAFEQFTSDVDHFTTQIRIRHFRNRQGSVGLDGNAKTKIHHFIDQIRSVIENADLPVQKRDSLYRKLDKFALEVDQTRTGLQAAMVVYIEICNGIGQGFEKLEPVRKMFDSIGALLGRAKEIEDSSRPALPTPLEQKRLEPPRRQFSPPTALQVADLDDEVPF